MFSTSARASPEVPGLAGTSRPDSEEDQSRLFIANESQSRPSSGVSSTNGNTEPGPGVSARLEPAGKSHRAPPARTSPRHRAESRPGSSTTAKWAMRSSWAPPGRSRTRSKKKRLYGRAQRPGVDRGWCWAPARKSPPTATAILAAISTWRGWTAGPRSPSELSAAGRLPSASSSAPAVYPRLVHPRRPPCRPLARRFLRRHRLEEPGLASGLLAGERYERARSTCAPPPGRFTSSARNTASLRPGDDEEISFWGAGRDRARNPAQPFLRLPALSLRAGARDPQGLLGRRNRALPQPRLASLNGIRTPPCRAAARGCGSNT